MSTSTVEERSIFGESLPPHTVIEWPAPPRVVPALGQLPFAAPSARGQVHRVEPSGDAQGLATRVWVRFHYRNPTGGMSWSAPIAVLPGQPCSVVTP